MRQRGPPFLHDTALASPGGLIWILRLLRFSNHQFKSFRNIGIKPCTGFREAATEFFGQFASLFGGNMPLISSQVALVPHNHQRNPVSSLQVD